MIEKKNYNKIKENNEVKYNSMKYNEVKDIVYITM